MEAPVGFELWAAGRKTWTAGVSSGESPLANGARPCHRLRNFSFSRAGAWAAADGEIRQRSVKAARSLFIRGSPVATYTRTLVALHFQAGGVQRLEHFANSH